MIPMGIPHGRKGRMANGNTPMGGTAARGASRRSLVARVFFFYYEGFRSMSRTWKIVWLIVLIKLFVMFAVLKVFFFPNYLNTRYDTNEQRSEHVLEELTRKNN